MLDGQRRIVLGAVSVSASASILPSSLGALQRADLLIVAILIILLLARKRAQMLMRSQSVLWGTAVLHKDPFVF